MGKRGSLDRQARKFGWAGTEIWMGRCGNLDGQARKFGWIGTEIWMGRREVSAFPDVQGERAAKNVINH